MRKVTPFIWSVGFGWLAATALGRGYFTDGREAGAMFLIELTVFGFLFAVDLARWVRGRFTGFAPKSVALALGAGATVFAARYIWVTLASHWLLIFAAVVVAGLIVGSGIGRRDKRKTDAPDRSPGA